MQRFSCQRMTLTVLIFYAVLLFLWLKSRNGSLAYQPADDESLQSIKNTTLGFEKIFAIGFSDRTDKRDAITLGASLLDLDVDWIEGVDYRTMNPKAFPAAWTEEKHSGKPGDIGAWRAHMNALQTIVRNRISSALIVEDDVDFDVSLKKQMMEFARGSHVIQETQGNPKTSPYGDDWDMLWLGYCGMKIFEEQRGQPRRIYVIPNDPTLRPPQYKNEFFGPTIAEFPGMEPHRLIFDASDGVCSIAFAISYEGARKALAAFAMMGIDEPMDLSYRYMCNGMFPLRFRCIAPYPTLISSWRQSGFLWRDSDIIETAPPEWHDAHSVGIVYSTMLNAVPLADGSKTVRAQWDDVVPLEINPDTFEIPRGVLWLPDKLE